MRKIRVVIDYLSNVDVLVAFRMRLDFLRIKGNLNIMPRCIGGEV
ncbi:hypothetical protein [Thermococcus sp. MV5]|nr:hypothetical protein [Thermococcus sp. MV5]